MKNINEYIFLPLTAATTDASIICNLSSSLEEYKLLKVGKINIGVKENIGVTNFGGLVQTNTNDYNEYKIGYL